MSRTREHVESDAERCAQIRALGFGAALDDALSALLQEAREEARARGDRAVAARQEVSRG